MKQMLKQTMCCFSLALMGSLSAMAAPSVMIQNQVTQTKQQKELPNPERDARRETAKLKETLNLTDKQYEKIYKLNLKEAKSRMQNQNSQNMPSRPNGPMGNGGGGMNVPMGPPPSDGGQMGGGQMGGGPMGGGRPMGGGMGMPQPSQDMQKQMQQRDKKFKKILTTEQYEKWKTMKPEMGQGGQQQGPQNGERPSFQKES